MRRTGYDQAAPLLDFTRVFTGTDVLQEVAARAVRTRTERRQQQELPLPGRPREATAAELRDLLRRLPLRLDGITCRRDKRALRTAHARRWVAEQAAELHLTADGRSALEQLLQPHGRSQRS